MVWTSLEILTYFLWVATHVAVAWHLALQNRKYEKALLASLKNKEKSPEQYLDEESTPG